MIVLNIPIKTKFKMYPNLTYKWNVGERFFRVYENGWLVAYAKEIYR